MTYYIKNLFFQYLKSPYTYMGLFLPILFILGLGVILPAALIIPSAITVSIIIIVFFLFGGTIQEMRKTSIVNSMALTKLNKTSIFLVNIFVATILTFIATIFILLFSFFLDQKFEFLAVDYSGLSGTETGILTYLNAEIIWGEIRWFTLLYAIFLTVAVSFSIVFLILAFSKSTTALYIFSFIYLLMLIIGGGVLLPSIIAILIDSDLQIINKLIPHHYTNELMMSSLVNENTVLRLFLGNSELIESLTNRFNIEAIQHDLDTMSNEISSNDGLTGSELANMQFESKLFTILNMDYFEYGNFKSDGLVADMVVIYLDAADTYKETLIRKTVTLSSIEITMTNSILYGILLDGGKLGFDTIDILNAGIIFKTFNDVTIQIPSKIMDFLSIFGIVLGQYDVLQAYFRNTTAWDWSNLNSMLNSFAPLIFAVFAGSIGIYKFNWSIRA